MSGPSATASPRMTDAAADPSDALFRTFIGGGPQSQQAFTALCQLLTGEYLGRVRRFGGTLYDAQEVVQRMFVRLWKNGSKIQLRTTARAYLLTCLKHEWASYKREWQRENRRKAGYVDTIAEDGVMNLLPGQQAQSPEADAEEIALEMNRLRQADCMSRAFQEFGLRYPERALAVEKQELDGWSIDEIAQVLGRTYTATKQFLSASRKALRTFAMERCREQFKEW